MADILIRGMEMPKEKNLWLCIKTDGTVYNIKPGGIGTAHAVGTAVPLPEGHGRLTDADELLDTMRFHRDHAELNDVMLGLDEAVGIVMNATTIVPEEGDADND